MAPASQRCERDPGTAPERTQVARARRSQRTLVISGTLSIVAGGVAVLVPAVASVGTAIFIGIVLLLAAAALALDAISAGGLGGILLRALAAVVMFAAGVYLLVSPLEGTFTLTVMLVLLFMGVGIARIATGLAEIGKPGAGYTIAAGVVSLVIGVLIARRLPSAADWAIGLLVGLDFLVYGALCLGRAWLPDQDPVTARPIAL